MTDNILMYYSRAMTQQCVTGNHKLYSSEQLNIMLQN